MYYRFWLVGFEKTKEKKDPYSQRAGSEFELASSLQKERLFRIYCFEYID